MATVTSSKRHLDITSTTYESSGNVEVGGRVGIGTGNPLDLIHAKSSTTDSRMILDGFTGFDSELKFAENGVVKYTIGNDAASDNFVIGTINVDTNPRMVIDSSGRVGIGTTSPSAKLHVYGPAGNQIRYSSPNVTNILGVTGSDEAIIGTVTNHDLLLYSNSAEVMRIDSSGNVGIGTTSPHYALHVKGTGDFQALKLQGGGSANQYTELGFLPSTSDATNANIYIRGHRGSDGAFANNYLTFGTNNTERLRLDSSGRLGIGTDSPDENLHIKDSSGANIILNSSTGSVNNGIYMTEGGDSTPLQNGAYFYYDSSANAVKLDTGTSTLSNRITVLRDSGNVGIGTTTPARELEVEGAGNVYIRVTARTDADSTAIELKNTQETWQIRNEDTNDNALEFLDDSGTQVTFKRGGNVGIGTDSPGTLFTVQKDGTQATSVSATYQIQTVSDSNGGIAIQAGSNSRAYLVFGDQGDYDAGRISYTNSTNSLGFYTSNSEKITILSDGNVGIGVTSPYEKLHVNGKLYVNSGQVWDATTQGTGRGSIHLDPNTATDHAGGAITWGASDSSNGESAQAGIYVRSDGSYGTKMYFSTTDSYASGSKTRMTILSNGHVGIGTNAPAARLSVAQPSYGDTTVLLGRINGKPSIKADSSEGGYLILDSHANAAAINHYSSNNVWIATGGGNVGIGTTSPSGKLNVVGGNIHVNSGGDKQLRFSGTGKNTYSFEHDASRFYIYDETSAAARFTIMDGGNIGIGTVTPSAKLEVNGSATFQGGVIINGHTQSTQGVQTITTTSGTINLNTSLYGIFRLTSALTGATTLNLQSMKSGQVIDVILSGDQTVTLSSDDSSETFNRVGDSTYDGTSTNHLQIVCIDDTNSAAIYNFTVTTIESATTI